MKRLFVLIAVLALVPVSLVAAKQPAEGRSGRAEVRFLEGMIDHHQMALDMANDCLKKAVGDELKTLCQNVIKAQTPEIEMMQKWLADWYEIDYQPVAMDAMPGMGGMDMGGMATDPAGMMGMMAGFNRLDGAEYEIAWLESMIDHHDDALHMSYRVLRWGMHPELIDLAKNIIRDQSAEIAQMELMIADRENQ
jgi:uncharacterized protein (DUF305 family)